MINEIPSMKKHLKTIIVCTLLPILLSGQNKFSFGVNLNSELSFLTIQEANVEESTGDLVEEGGTALGYALGMQVEYSLNQNLFLRSGVTYQLTQHRHKISGFTFGTGNPLEPLASVTLESNTFISSIGIPLDLGCRIPSKNGKINFLLGIGAQLNLMLDTSFAGKLISDTGEDSELEMLPIEVEESIFSLGMFTGVEFGIGDKLMMGIEPNVRIAPNKFTLYLFESKAKTMLETGLTIRGRMK